MGGFFPVYKIKGFEKMGLTGKEKAMILLSILGNDLASKIMEHLPQEYANLIASSIDHLPKPSSEAISAVLNDFSSFMALEKAPIKREIEEKTSIAKDHGNQNIETQPSARSPLDILFYSHPKKIAIALSAERIPVVAFILSFLPNVQSSEVLSFMNERRKEIEITMRNMKKPPIAEAVKVGIIEILAKRLERLAA